MLLAWIELARWQYESLVAWCGVLLCCARCGLAARLGSGVHARARASARCPGPGPGPGPGPVGGRWARAWAVARVRLGSCRLGSRAGLPLARVLAGPPTSRAAMARTTLPLWHRGAASATCSAGARRGSAALASATSTRSAGTQAGRRRPAAGHWTPTGRCQTTHCHRPSTRHEPEP